MLQSGLIVAVFSAIFAFQAIDNANGNVVYETSEPDEKVHIKGGYNVPIWMHPWQVLVSDGGIICGGTILTEIHILTAAHCVYGSRGFWVKTGTSYATIEKEYKVKEIWMHPRYNDRTHINDIAVLQLARPIEFDVVRQPARLPTRDIKMGELANVTGYGSQLYEQETSKMHLHATKVQLTSCIYNEVHMKDVSEYQICAYSPVGIGACMGDSGGPLTIGNTVVGVVSYGVDGCANGLPQVYSNVFKYLPFIREVFRRTVV